MKKETVTIIALAMALIITIAVEEFRISKLRNNQRIETASDSKSAPEKTISQNAALSAGRKGTLRQATRNPSNKEDKEPSEIGKSMRKMADNPALKAMLAQGQIATAQSLYGKLLEQFDLSEEEKDYFLKLVAGELADQQEMGMKLMGTKDSGEREALVEESERKKEERKELIKEFLNNDDDMASYEDFNDRLPEHQQMPGIQAAFDAKGMSLSSEEQTALAEAMYQTRKESNMGTRWEGASGMELLEQDNVVELFEQDWNDQQALLRNRLNGVLGDDKLEVFQTTQEQMKELQLMGIKMVSGMMKSQ